LKAIFSSFDQLSSFNPDSIPMNKFMAIDMLKKMEYSKHFQEMLEERKIYPAWVEQTLEMPDHTEIREDGTCHFIKQIQEYENRWLRIVVNVCVNPNRVITAFFDRRLRRMKP
jgi:hypothetical protein